MWVHIPQVEDNCSRKQATSNSKCNIPVHIGCCKTISIKLRFWNSLCCYFQIRSVAAPELCVDTENKKADERFGLKNCAKDDRRSAGEQVRIPADLPF
jgi:hypothetical protein